MFAWTFACVVAPYGSFGSRSAFLASMRTIRGLRRAWKVVAGAYHSRLNGHHTRGIRMARYSIERLIQILAERLEPEDMTKKQAREAVGRLSILVDFAMR